MQKFMKFPSREELEIKKAKRIQELKDRGLLIDEPIKYIDEDGFDRSVEFEVAEESKIYSWIRLYMSDEVDDMISGDVVKITYVPTGESTEVTFATYNKVGLNKDGGETVIDYNQEEDKKVLCLMVDINEINSDTSIPLLRTMFKGSKWHQHQLLKRNDLKFECEEKGIVFDTYYSVDF